MSMIKKLNENCYIEWSSMCDAPLGEWMTYRQAVYNHGQERVDRAAKYGSSCIPEEYENDPCAFNRAGLHETQLSVQEIITAYKDQKSYDEFKEKCKNDIFWKIREKLSLGTSITLPIDFSSFFMDLLFDNLNDEVINKLEQASDIFDDYLDYYNGVGSTSFSCQTESLIALYVSLSSIDDHLKVSVGEGLIKRHWSKGQENGKPPNLDFFSIIMCQLIQQPDGPEEQPVSSKVLSGIIPKTLERDVCLIRSILKKLNKSGEKV